MIDLLVSQYNFDPNLYKYRHTIDLRNDIIEIDISLFHIVFLNKSLYDEKFLDTLIYKYKYNVNKITMIDYGSTTIITYFLTDVINGTYLKQLTYSEKEWIINYMKSRGAIMIC